MSILDAPLYWVDDSEVPDSHKRTVIEFVQRDEYARTMFKYHTEKCGLPYTECICNGKYHGVRSLTSFWQSELDEAKTCEEIRKALTQPPLIGNPSPDTPKVSDVPARVLNYMREGHIHYSREELEKHAVFSIKYVGDFSYKVEMMQSMERVPNSFRVTTDMKNGGTFITATFAGWKKYLEDVRQMNYMLNREPSEVYNLIHEIFYRTYPKPTTPILVRPYNEEDADPLWGRR